MDRHNGDGEVHEAFWWKTFPAGSLPDAHLVDVRR